MEYSISAFIYTQLYFYFVAPLVFGLSKPCPEALKAGLLGTLVTVFAVTMCIYIFVFFDYAFAYTGER